MEDLGKTEWDDFTEEEKLVTENTVLLVSLLHQMCKVQLVLVSPSKDEHGTVNSLEVNRQIRQAEQFIEERKLA